jgi:adenosylcobinamide kinase/adenosylcobinamide-phosphate guanylyltransferase
VPSIFITGPVRSGKSRFAERLARERCGDVTYVATARHDPGDPQWVERIARHAARRPAGWRLVETAADGAPSLESVCAEAAATETLVVDSLGTWLAAQMAPGVDPELLEARAHEAVSALLGTRAHAIVVGEEVGWGIVPAYPSGRLFRDVLGRAQQRLAAHSASAFLVVAGFALDLRRHGTVVEAPRAGAPRE